MVTYQKLEAISGWQKAHECPCGHIYWDPRPDICVDCGRCAMAMSTRSARRVKVLPHQRDQFEKRKSRKTGLLGDFLRDILKKKPAHIHIWEILDVDGSGNPSGSHYEKGYEVIDGS